MTSSPRLTKKPSSSSTSSSFSSCTPSGRDRRDASDDEEDDDDPFFGPSQAVFPVLRRGTPVPAAKNKLKRGIFKPPELLREAPREKPIREELCLSDLITSPPNNKRSKLGRQKPLKLKTKSIKKPPSLVASTPKDSVKMATFFTKSIELSSVKKRFFQDTPKDSSPEEDVITLEDDEVDENSGENGTDQNGKENSPNENETYIPGLAKCDYLTLASGEYINDSIINFYLNYLHENLSEDHRKYIHIFSTHFYSKLITKSGKRKKEDLGKSASVLAYERVKNWTKRVDLFTKRMVIVPICEDYHWFVVIICNPGSVGEPKDTHIIQGPPFFLVLDSLGTDQGDSAVRSLRSYLSKECEARRGKHLVFEREVMAAKKPEIPYQANSCDCGIFLLHYIELIFKKPGDFCFFGQDKELNEWFEQDAIDNKREEIAKLIQTLSREHHSNRGKSIVFPELSFAPVREHIVGDAVPAKDDSDEEEVIVKRTTRSRSQPEVDGEERLKQQEKEEERLKQDEEEERLKQEALESVKQKKEESKVMEEAVEKTCEVALEHLTEEQIQERLSIKQKVLCDLEDQNENEQIVISEESSASEDEIGNSQEPLSRSRTERKRKKKKKERKRHRKEKKKRREKTSDDEVICDGYKKKDRKAKKDRYNESDTEEEITKPKRRQRRSSESDSEEKAEQRRVKRRPEFRPIEEKDLSDFESAMTEPKADLREQLTKSKKTPKKEAPPGTFAGRFFSQRGILKRDKSTSKPSRVSAVVSASKSLDSEPSIFSSPLVGSTRNARLQTYRRQQPEEAEDRVAARKHSKRNRKVSDANASEYLCRTFDGAPDTVAHNSRVIKFKVKT